MTDWPDDETALSHFREWLDDARREAQELPDLTDSALQEQNGRPIGLLQLIEEFTSLRHEVKLQTKSSRGAQEKSDGLLSTLQQALDQLESAKADAIASGRDMAEPLVSGLVDLDESLHRGRAAIESARKRLLEEATQELEDLRNRLDQLFDLQPWWRRRLCRPWHEAVKSMYFRRAVELQRGVFDSLLEGYGLMQSRLARVLRENDIQRMECIGNLANPHCMSVVEVVEDDAHPPGWVLAEIRLGYYWQGKVFRFAEVKAVQGSKN